MILRIMEEGQLEIPDGALDELNELDEELIRAVEAGDEEHFRTSMEALLGRVREVGKPVPEDYLGPSDVFLPSADSTIADVRHLMDEEGLLPG